VRAYPLILKVSVEEGDGAWGEGDSNESKAALMAAILSNALEGASTWAIALPPMKAQVTAKDSNFLASAGLDNILIGWINVSI
jgi:hypothetical protein